jgi:hypothetical protein
VGSVFLVIIVHFVLSFLSLVSGTLFAAGRQHVVQPAVARTSQSHRHLHSDTLSHYHHCNTKSSPDSSAADQLRVHLQPLDDVAAAQEPDQLSIADDRQLAHIGAR